jgi:hypothetical protein
VTRLDTIPAARDEDTKLIDDLRRQLAVVTTDRDELLRGLASITTALCLPEGTELHKLINRIQEIM